MAVVSDPGRLLALLTVGSPDWTLPPSHIPPRTVDALVPDSHSSGGWVTAGSGVRALVDAEPLRHKVLLGLTDLDQLTYRTLLWLYADHRSNRDLDLLVAMTERDVTPHVPLTKAGKPRRQFLIRQYIALALCELAGLSLAAFAGRLACRTCSGTGAMRTDDGHQVGCPDCGGEGVHEWSQGRRAEALGIDQRAWRRNHEDAYQVVLRRIRGTALTGLNNLWRAIPG